MKSDTGFFGGVRQETIEAEGLLGKLPCFYYDARALGLVYSARLDRLEALLPDSRYRPLRLTPSRGLLAITAFEYRHTDIGPYNELSIAVLLERPGRGGPPPIGAIRQNWAQTFHAFVWQLPVTTEIARRGGVELYGYPKFLAAIEFSERPDEIRCRLAVGDREILHLSGPKPTTRPGRVATYFTYPCRDGQILKAEVRVNPIAVGVAFRPARVRLEFDRAHPIGATLGSLDLRPRPLEVRYLARMQAILFRPEPFGRAVETEGRVGSASARAGRGARGSVGGSRQAQSAACLSRRALPTTETELRLIAAAANIGDRSRPNTG